MQKKYRFNKPDYAVGENEKLYNDMAAQGWQLVKRGSWLSTFEEGKKDKYQYRVEIVKEGTIPTHQISDLKHKGWEIAAENGVVHVFRGSPKKSPNFFQLTLPQRDYVIDALKQEYILSAFIAAALLLVIAFILMSKMVSALWLHSPEALMMLAAFVLLFVFRTLYNSLRTRELKVAIQEGEPIDRSIKSGMRPHRIIEMSLLAMIAAIAIAGFAVVSSYETRPMPESSDGTYITLSEMGWDMPRVEGEDGAVAASVEESRNLLFDVCDSYEYISDGEESECIMSIQAYTPHFAFLEGMMPELIIASAGRDVGSYEARDIEGLDLALYGESGLEYIAMKDGIAYHIAYADPASLAGGQSEKDPLATLAAK